MLQEIPNLTDQPPTPLLPPPSQEVAVESISRAKSNGVITAEAADTLKKVSALNPRLVESVLQNSGRLGKPPTLH